MLCQLLPVFFWLTAIVTWITHDGCAFGYTISYSRGDVLFEPEQIDLRVSDALVTLFVRLCDWEIIGLVRMTRYCYCLDESDDTTCSTPGPTLLMESNTNINVTLVNQLDGSVTYYGPGSENFNNFKDMDITNLHVHGLHVSPSEDDIFMRVLPNEDSHSYLYSFGYHYPGTHWYHGHHHGSVTWQLIQGLYGAILMHVNDSYTDWISDTYDETVLMFNHQYLYSTSECIDASKNVTDKDYCLNKVVNYTTYSACYVYCNMPADQRANSGYTYDLESDEMNGDLKLFVNGQWEPVIDKLTTGHYHRLRMINSLSSFYIQFLFPSECDWNLIATDGIYIPDDFPPISGKNLTNGTAAGYYQLKETPFKNFYLIAPGSRADFLVKCDMPGLYNISSSRDISRDSGRLGGVNRTPAVPVLFSINVTDVDVDVDVNDTIDYDDTELPIYENTLKKPKGTYVEDLVENDDIEQDCFCQKNVSTKESSRCRFFVGRSLRNRNFTEGPFAAMNRQSFYYDEESSYWPYLNNSLSFLEKDKPYSFLIDTGDGHPFHMHTNPFQIKDYLGQQGYFALSGTYWDTLGFYANSESDAKNYQALTWARDFEGLILVHCHEVQHSDLGMKGFINVLSDTDYGSSTCEENNSGISSSQADNCDELSNVADSGEIIGIVYATAYFTFLLVIMFLFYDKAKDVSANLTFIYRQRSIYGPIIATLFDHASDVSVLYVWYEYYLIESSKKYECEFNEIPIINYIIASVIIFLLTRFFEILMMTKFLGIADHTWKYTDFILVFFDLYGIKQVYLSHKNSFNNQTSKPKKTAMLELVLLNEVLFESIPQIILQSIFIIYNSQLIENAAVFFVSISLSLIAASHKILTIDNTYKSFDASLDYPHFSCKCPVINYRWLLRMLWRYDNLICRTFLFILLLVCCGDYGIYILVMFIFVSIACYFYFAFAYCFDFDVVGITSLSTKFWLVFLEFFVIHFIATIWSADNRFNEKLCCSLTMPSVHVVYRIFENLMLYLIILCFILFYEDNKSDDLFDNEYIYSYFIVATVTLIIEPILYMTIKSYSQQMAVSTKIEVEKMASQTNASNSTPAPASPDLETDFASKQLSSDSDLIKHQTSEKQMADLVLDEKQDTDAPDAQTPETPEQPDTPDAPKKTDASEADQAEKYME